MRTTLYSIPERSLILFTSWYWCIVLHVCGQVYSIPSVHVPTIWWFYRLVCMYSTRTIQCSCVSYQSILSRPQLTDHAWAKWNSRSTQEAICYTTHGVTFWHCCLVLQRVNQYLVIVHSISCILTHTRIEHTTCWCSKVPSIHYATNIWSHIMLRFTAHRW